MTTTTTTVEKPVEATSCAATTACAATLNVAPDEPYASVALGHLDTLWFNTGTLCNITCQNCYIESTPRNDRLSYITLDEIKPYLDEIERDGLGTREIGFTGGEPFMNPQICEMVEECLKRGFNVMLLTNAMKPMHHRKKKLLELHERYGDKLTIRVSLDDYTAERHDLERGANTFAKTLDGLTWLARNGFKIAVGGRTMWGEDAATERAGYRQLFAEHSISINACSPAELVLFPEMNAKTCAPKVTESFLKAAGKTSECLMCNHSRMVVKRKGAEHPVVVACTLLPYDPEYEMGPTLRTSKPSVPLSHPHCAQFCVLGGASCSPGAH
jgi:sulfatase maturation enzyme AslB (radical SAM superfamily)